MPSCFMKHPTCPRNSYFRTFYFFQQYERRCSEIVIVMPHSTTFTAGPVRDFFSNGSKFGNMASLKTFLPGAAAPGRLFQKGGKTSSREPRGKAGDHTDRREPTTSRTSFIVCLVARRFSSNIFSLISSSYGNQADNPESL